MKVVNIFFVILLFGFYGCGKTAATAQHTSPNGKVKLMAVGNRSTSLDSWKVELKVNAYSFKEDELSFEIYASDLNAETVLFNWSDEQHCTIVFKQTDNTERKFSLSVSPEHLELKEK
jgi:hypothetical protein